MSTLLAAGLIAAILAPQQPPPSASGLDAAPRVELIGGAVDRAGRVDLTRLRLGDGGVDAEREPPAAEGQGRFRTSGGVLIRALNEGVKLDFPSGGELLVDPRGRVHLRDGNRTLPSFSGVQLHLLDGSVLDVVPQNGSDRPLREVVVRDGEKRVQLWRAGRRSARAGVGGAAHGRVLHALGDGRVLFEIAAVGPALVLDRALCPNALRGEVPARCLFIIGDVLARSLIEVSSIAKERAAGDPRTQNIATALAHNAPRMFGPGVVHARPAGARGDLVVPLDAGFRLSMVVPAGGPIVLALVSPGEVVPLCEWTTTNTTRLHLVQRDAGEGGKPRYLMRGHPIGRLVDALLGFEPSATSRARARRVLVELGAG